MCKNNAIMSFNFYGTVKVTHSYDYVAQAKDI